MKKVEFLTIVCLLIMSATSNMFAMVRYYSRENVQKRRKQSQTIMHEDFQEMTMKIKEQSQAVRDYRLLEYSLMLIGEYAEQKLNKSKEVPYDGKVIHINKKDINELLNPYLLKLTLAKEEIILRNIKINNNESVTVYIFITPDMIISSHNETKKLRTHTKKSDNIIPIEPATVRREYSNDELSLRGVLKTHRPFYIEKDK